MIGLLDPGTRGRSETEEDKDTQTGHNAKDQTHMRSGLRIYFILPFEINIQEDIAHKLSTCYESCEDP